LDYPEGTEPSSLPLAAIVDILERGNLTDWAPLAREIAAKPDGTLARALARLIDEFPMYGTSPLWRAFLDRQRAAPSRRLTLAELRLRAGLTQVEVAERIGISQSDLSKLERRQDLRVSSLMSLVHVLGGKLRMRASMPDGEFDITLANPALDRI